PAPTSLVAAEGRGALADRGGGPVLAADEEGPRRVAAPRVSSADRASALGPARAGHALDLRGEMRDALPRLHDGPADGLRADAHLQHVPLSPLGTTKVSLSPIGPSFPGRRAITWSADRVRPVDQPPDRAALRRSRNR